eukprot:m.245364 g.245364  ORF g.245364 m.245364 type:complete len:134 (+) comp40254_c3_seq93:30-431(+)
MAEGRLKSYKNKEVPDALGLRQRREEEGIQIRKSKREDELWKRRKTQQQTPDATEFKLSDCNMNVPVLERFAADVYSDDAERHRIGCRGIRSLLSKSMFFGTIFPSCQSDANDSSIDDVIATGIVPQLVEFVH